MEFKFYTDDNGDFIVEGVASTGSVDSSKEIVDPMAIKNSIDSYMKYGLIKEMHERVKSIGKAKEVYQDELGRTIIKFILVGDEIIEKVKKGIYTGLSIGFLPLKSIIKDGKKIYTEIKWVETSLVDIPCNEDCMITSFKFNDLSIDIQEDLIELKDSQEIIEIEDVLEVKQSIVEVEDPQHEKEEMTVLNELKSMLSEVLMIVKKDIESDMEEMNSKFKTFEEESINKSKQFELDMVKKYEDQIELIKKEYEDKLIEQKVNFERVLSQKINKSHASVIQQDDDFIAKKYQNNQSVKALYNIFK